MLTSSPQDGLHKHTQGLYVNPRDEGLTEIHFQPAYQRPLDGQQQHFNRFK